MTSPGATLQGVPALAELTEQLNKHPVYALRNLDDLRHYMAHQVYSVWDFMSLIKFLQGVLAPTRYPWQPVGDPAVRRFINELTMEEESDSYTDTHGQQIHLSHFELYCGAMRELGGDPTPPLRFVSIATTQGIDAALAAGIAPAPSARFVRATFNFLASGKAHVVAAALAVGREKVIPGMFRSFLREMQVSELEAPLFHFYLQRHIHLDEDFHAPMSLRMLDLLCAGDPTKIREAQEAAILALRERLAFWDGVYAGMQELAA